jgi:acyl-CoA synthetase (NDP forming)
VPEGLAMGKEQIFNQAKSENRTYLTEVESKELLKEAGIPIIDTSLARTKKEAVSLSREIGFPVALKIVSPDVIHKTDSGGVKLDLRNPNQVANAYSDILSSIKGKLPQANICGISIQAMAPRGVEVIIGMTKDPQFGPVLMFGLGGILVELLRDVSFRIVPLTRIDAKEMITEIKGYSLLKGYRGMEGVSISALEDILLDISNFVDKTPEVKELDLNPIVAYKNGAIAVDARVILQPWQG